MNYNKKEFAEINNKKILHKVKKQWITISVALLGILGMGGVVTQTHVNANATQADDHSAHSPTYHNQPSLIQKVHGQLSAQSPGQILGQAHRMTNDLIRKQMIKNGSSHDLSRHSGQLNQSVSSHRLNLPVTRDAHQLNNQKPVRIGDGAANLLPNSDVIKLTNEVTGSDVQVNRHRFSHDQLGSQQQIDLGNLNSQYHFASDQSDNYLVTGSTHTINLLPNDPDWKNLSWGEANVEINGNNDTVYVNGGGTVGNGISDSDLNQDQSFFNDVTNDSGQSIGVLPNHNHDWKLVIQNATAPSDAENLFNSYHYNGEPNLPASDFTSIDLSGLEMPVNGMTTTSKMFYNDRNLTSITFGRSFNTSDVSDMSSMFDGDNQLQSLDLSSFNVQAVSDMDAMFWADHSLKSITFGSDFVTSSANRMHDMFGSDQSLTELDLSTFNTQNQPDVGNMFRSDPSLDKIVLGPNASFNDTAFDDNDAEDNYSDDGLDEYSPYGWIAVRDPRYPNVNVGKQITTNQQLLPNNVWKRTNEIINYMFGNTKVGSDVGSRITDVSDQLPGIPAGYAVDPRNYNLPFLTSNHQYSRKCTKGVNTVQVDLTGMVGTARWYLTPNANVPYAEWKRNSSQTMVDSLPANELLITNDGHNNASLPSGNGYDNLADGTTSGTLLHEIAQQAGQAVNMQHQNLNINLSDLENRVRHLIIYSDVAAPVNAAGLFSGFHVLSDFQGSDLDTSSTKWFSDLFANDWKLRDLSSLSNWSTKNAINLSGMFANNPGHSNQITNLNALSGWNQNSSHYSKLNQMFMNDQQLTNVGALKNWFINKNKLSNLSDAFSGDSKLKDLTPLTNWDVRSVTNLSNLFASDPQVSDWSGIYHNWYFKGDPKANNMLKGTGYEKHSQNHDPGYPYSDSVTTPFSQLTAPDRHYWSTNDVPEQLNHTWHFTEVPVKHLQLQIKFYSDHWTYRAGSDGANSNDWKWEYFGGFPAQVPIYNDTNNDVMSDLENYLKLHFDNLLPTGYKFEPNTKAILIFSSNPHANASVKAVEYDFDHSQFKMINGLDRKRFTTGYRIGSGPILLLLSRTPRISASAHRSEPRQKPVRPKSSSHGQNKSAVSQIVKPTKSQSSSSSTFRSNYGFKNSKIAHRSTVSRPLPFSPVHSSRSVLSSQASQMTTSANDTLTDDSSAQSLTNFSQLDSLVRVQALGTKNNSGLSAVNRSQPNSSSSVRVTNHRQIREPAIRSVHHHRTQHRTLFKSNRNYYTVLPHRFRGLIYLKRTVGEYRHLHYSRRSRVKYLVRGKRFRVIGIRRLNRAYRFELTNHHYVTARKSYVRLLKVRRK